MDVVKGKISWFAPPDDDRTMTFVSASRPCRTDASDCRPVGLSTAVAVTQRCLYDRHLIGVALDGDAWLVVQLTLREQPLFVKSGGQQASSRRVDGEVESP